MSQRTNRVLTILYWMGAALEQTERKASPRELIHYACYSSSELIELIRLDASNARRFNEYIDEKLIPLREPNGGLDISEEEEQAIFEGLRSYLFGSPTKSFTECMQEAYAKKGLKLVF